MKIHINCEFDTDEDETQISQIQTLFTLYKEKGNIIVDGDVRGFYDIISNFYYRLPDVEESLINEGIDISSLDRLVSMMRKLAEKIELICNKVEESDT